MSDNIDVFFDIGTARLAHLRWQAQLEELLKKGKGNVSLESYTSCALGNWLYSSALKKYGHMSDIVELEKTHEQFHSNAENIIRCVGRDSPDQAMESFSQLQGTSKDIVYLLTLIELKMMNHFIFVDSLKHPLKAVKRFFKKN